MNRVATYTNNRIKRHLRVRAKVSGTSDRPRLAVFRSSEHIYAQIIDDKSRKTLVSGSDLQVSGKITSEQSAEAKTLGASPRKFTKTEKAAQVGKLLAEQAKKAKIARVAFDRGGFAYHGRVRALAEAARAGGLEF